LLAYLARVYPALGNERPEYAWEGLFAETPDGLPYVGVHRRYPRHLFALGYGGNGMTASFLAAQLLLKRYRKDQDPRESLFAFNR
jgi:glycine/D-amino acid oxidase-like deaminating enzyme